jgi:hypothetical protein
VRVRVGAASTTPGRASTARWFGFGKRDGEVYVCRNQWWNPLKKCDRLLNLVDGRVGSAPNLLTTGRDGFDMRFVSGATMKVCGVVVDRPAGEKLGTDPVDRSAVNVGTVSGSPSCWPARPAAARHAVC